MFGVPPILASGSADSGVNRGRENDGSSNKSGVVFFKCEYQSIVVIV
jgi:hypothetical protein